MTRTWIFVMAAAVLLAVAAGCGSSEPGGQDGVRSADAAAEIVVKMSDERYFEPARVEVRAGVPVRLKIDNSTNMALHDWTIEDIAVAAVKVDAAGAGDAGGHGHASEFDLHVVVDGGGDAMLEFTPNETGEYEFVCTVPGHTEAGMIGTLIVVA